MRRIIALLLLLLTATPATAQEASTAKQRARALFKEGEELYQRGEYQKAIDRYKEAFALVPLPLLLFDLGQAYRMSGERDKAIDHYRKYLDVEPGGRGAVEAREHLAEFAAQIQLELDAKRAAEQAKMKAAADEARRRADEEARKHAAVEEVRRRVAEEAHRRAEEEARRAAAHQQRSDDASHPLTLVAPPTTRRPIWKKAWLWGAVGGVVLVGVAVGLGVGLGTGHQATEPTLRPVDF